MDTKASHFLVGLFAVLGVVLLSVSFFVFDPSERSSAFLTYRLVFQGSVQGLTQGSQVTFNGIPVGNVAQVTFGETPSEVDVLISVSDELVLQRSTSATLSYRGLTGFASVELFGGDAQDEPFLPLEEDPGSSLRVRGSQITDALDGVRKLMDRATIVIEEVETLVSDNRESVRIIFENLGKLSSTLEENGQLLVTFMTDSVDFAEQVIVLTQNIASFTSDLQQIIEVVDAQTLGNIVGDAEQFMSGMASVADEAVDAVAETRTAVRAANDMLGGAQSLITAAEGVIGAVEVEALGTFITNAERFSNDLVTGGQDFSAAASGAREIVVRTDESVGNLLDAIEPLTQELIGGSGAEFLFEIVGATRSVSRAASQLASLTKNANERIASIGDELEQTIVRARIDLERISNRILLLAERFENRPQDFIFPGDRLPRYEP